MKLKGLVEYDISNYITPSMFLIFPHCTFKCDAECGQPICQNSSLARESEIEIKAIDIIQRYINNPLTHAIVCGGLEPLDSWDDLWTLCCLLRGFTNDPIIIYTGYKEEEIEKQIQILSKLSNVIVKFGRFIPNSPHIYDPLLGIELASNNQYAKNISEMVINDNSTIDSGENKNGK